MFFLYPKILYFIFLPFMLFMLSFKKQSKTQVEKLFSLSVLRQLDVVGEERISKTGKQRIFLVVIALFMLSLARPVTDEKKLFVQEPTATVIVAIDLSKSMLQKDIYPNRYLFAKKKLEDFIDDNNGLRIGVILFSKNSYMLYPLSTDLYSLKYMLNHFKIDKRFKSQTNIFSALEASKKMLNKYDKKNIILLSDGGESDDFTQEIKYLQKNKIRVYAIGIGDDNGTAINPNLQKLALQSGGIYKRYSWSNEDIFSIVDNIKKESLKFTQGAYSYKHYNEFFIYPLFIGLLLLFVVFTSILDIKKDIKFLPLFILFILSIPSPALKAGVLDFKVLHDAKTLYKEGRYKESIALYEKISKSSEVLYNMADALYRLNRYKQAVKIYSKAIGENVTLNAKIYYNMGNCCVRLDRLKLARKYYKKSLQISKNILVQQNLQKVDKAILQELKSRAKPRKKRVLKPMSVEYKEYGTPPSSDYEVEFKNLHLSRERRWIKLLQKQDNPIFLKKISTTKESKNAIKAW